MARAWGPPPPVLPPGPRPTHKHGAQAACLPIRPLRLSFNAPVPRKLAEGIRLKSGSETLKPRIEQEGDADSVVTQLSFAPPFTAGGKYTLQLPADFKDASGRTLANAASFPLPVAVGAMPPLAKFAASPFGIVERFAEGPQGPALLPRVRSTSPIRSPRCACRACSRARNRPRAR